MAKKVSIYKELIEELNNEVAEGVLKPEDTIQIIRDEKEILPDYHPIIDWYYDEFTMKEEIETPLEEMYLPEEFEKNEWEELKKSNEAYKAQYLQDQPNLKEVKLKDVLTEMKQIEKLM